MAIDVRGASLFSKLRKNRPFENLSFNPDLSDPDLISFLLALSNEERLKIVRQFNINPQIIKNVMEQQNFSNYLQKVIQEINTPRSNSGAVASQSSTPFLNPSERARRAEYVQKVLAGLRAESASSSSSTGSSTGSSNASFSDGLRNNGTIDDPNKKVEIGDPKSKKISSARAQEIYQNIFDDQISGSRQAKLEIEKKLLQTLEEKFNLSKESLLADKPNPKFSEILKNAFKAGGDQDPKLAEVKMLVSAIDQANDKINQLEIKKQDERLRQEMINILKESEEMIAFQLHQERRMKNMVIVVPAQKAQSINEIFGNAGIIHNASQVENEGNQNNANGNSQSANQNQQVTQQPTQVVEKVVLIEITSPVEHFNQLSKTSQEAQANVPAKPQLSSNTTQGTLSTTQGQGKASKPVVGEFTAAIVTARLGVEETLKKQLEVKR
ncbi:MAG: hypothetical protein ACKO47_05740 [Alphaproteobacteria bacterium]